MTNAIQTQTQELTEVQNQVVIVQQIYKEIMQKDEHYGVIPGTNGKPSLLKAGAEKLCLTFHLDPQYESQKEWNGKHLTVLSKCTLYHAPTGTRLGSGEGMCTTMESKYAYRKASMICPSCSQETIIKGKEEFGGGWLCYKAKGGCGSKFAIEDEKITNQKVGRVENENIADAYNTVLKMANKRSLVAAVLNVTAASDIFTQDLEDFKPLEAQVIVEPTKAPQAKVEVVTQSLGMDEPVHVPLDEKVPCPKCGKPYDSKGGKWKQCYMCGQAPKVAPKAPMTDDNGLDQLDF